MDNQRRGRHVRGTEPPIGVHLEQRTPSVPLAESGSTGTEHDLPGLAAQTQRVLGNAELLRSLSGQGDMLGDLVHGTMTLGVAGVPVPAIGEGSNRAMQSLLASRSARGQSGSNPQAAVSRALGVYGTPLPQGVADRLAGSFAPETLRRARLHHGTTSHEAAHAIAAEAFTVGVDIFFSAHADAAGSHDELELLAHELTHVEQFIHGQLQTSSSEGFEVSAPSDATEIEAERRAKEVTRALNAGPEVQSEPTPAPEGVATEPAGASPASAPTGGTAARSPSDPQGQSALSRTALKNINTIMEHIEQKKWDVDSLAEALTDDEMRQLTAAQREAILAYVSNGTVVANGDEATLLRLLGTTPSDQLQSVLRFLRNDRSALLKQLEDKLHGDEYKTYHDTLRALFFADMTPEQALVQMDGAQELPWADPGLFGRLVNDRFEYLDYGFTDSGKVFFHYWLDIGPLVFNDRRVELEPLQMIKVRFHYPEGHVKKDEGEVMYMPAVNLLNLCNEQFKRDVQLAVDIALLAVGGTAIIKGASKLVRLIAALETLLAAADVAVREFHFQLSKSESGRAFLEEWSKVQTAMLFYSIGRVAIEAPKAFRRIKQAWQKVKGKPPVGIDADGMKELDGHVQKVLNQADEISDAHQVNNALEGATDHVGSTNFPDRASRPTSQGVVKLTNGELVDAKNVIYLESLPDVPPGKQIKFVELLDEEGKVVGKLKSVETTGYGKAPQIPSEPAVTVRITQQDGGAVVWNSADPPPANFRLQINGSKTMKNSGFSGGHTRDAWEKTKATYGDILRETHTKQIAFTLEGGEELVVSSVEYQVKASSGFVDVANPKTLFEGSGNTALKAFEEALSSQLVAQLDALPQGVTELSVTVPVTSASGSPSSVIVKVHLSSPTTGAGLPGVETWYVDQAAFSDPTLMLTPPVPE